MELRNLAFACCVIFFAGCSAPSNIKNSHGNATFQSIAIEDFAVGIPSEASHKYVRSDQSVAYATFEAPTTDYKSSDYSIIAYPPTSLKSNKCSITLTGASQATSIDAETHWGRIDYFDQFKGGENPDPDSRPLCAPIGAGTAYALCSEKDGKTVVICISEMTDDPKLAEDIFKTFRWTK